MNNYKLIDCANCNECIEDNNYFDYIVLYNINENIIINLNTNQLYIFANSDISVYLERYIATIIAISFENEIGLSYPDNITDDILFSRTSNAKICYDDRKLIRESITNIESILIYLKSSLTNNEYKKIIMSL